MGVRLSPDQKDGEECAGEDVEGHTEAGPPGRDAGVVNQKVMKEIVDSVASESSRDNPEARFEADDGEDDESGCSRTLREQNGVRSAHSREEDVIVGDDDNDCGVEDTSAIESGEQGEDADCEREDDADQVFHSMSFWQTRFR